MAIEKTLSIIKPDAVGKNLIGKIISRFEDNGLCVVAAKLIYQMIWHLDFMLNMKENLFLMI